MFPLLLLNHPSSKGFEAISVSQLPISSQPSWWLLTHLGHRGQGLCEELYFAESQAAVLGHHPDLETTKVGWKTSNERDVDHPGSWLE